MVSPLPFFATPTPALLSGLSGRTIGYVAIVRGFTGANSWACVGASAAQLSATLTSSYVACSTGSAFGANSAFSLLAAAGATSPDYLDAVAANVFGNATQELVVLMRDTVLHRLVVCARAAAGAWGLLACNSTALPAGQSCTTASLVLAPLLANSSSGHTPVLALCSSASSPSTSVLAAFIPFVTGRFAVVLLPPVPPAYVSEQVLALAWDPNTRQVIAATSGSVLAMPATFGTVPSFASSEVVRLAGLPSLPLFIYGLPNRAAAVATTSHGLLYVPTSAPSPTTAPLSVAMQAFASLGTRSATDGTDGATDLIMGAAVLDRDVTVVLAASTSTSAAQPFASAALALVFTNMNARPSVAYEPAIALPPLPVTIAGSSQIFIFRLLHFDTDAYLDMLVGVSKINDVGGRVSLSVLLVYFGNSGSFELPVQIWEGLGMINWQNMARSVYAAVADLNGDSYLDVAIANSGPQEITFGAVYVVWQLPGRSFSSELVEDFAATSSGYPNCMAVGNFVGDAQLDLFVGVLLGSGNARLYERRAGAWVTRAPKMATNGADLDNYYVEEICFAGQFLPKPAPVGILGVERGKTSASLFQVANASLGTFQNQVSISLKIEYWAVTDVTRDGLTDIVAMSGTSDSPYPGLVALVATGIGVGNFAAHAIDPLRPPETFLLADMNGDTRLDIVFAGVPVSYMAGIASSPFFNKTVIYLPLNVATRRQMEVADWNGDGAADIFFIRDDKLYVYLSSRSSSRKWHLVQALVPGSGHPRIKTLSAIGGVDVDGDGASDLGLGWFQFYGTKPTAISTFWRSIPHSIGLEILPEANLADQYGQPELGAPQFRLATFATQNEFCSVSTDSFAFSCVTQGMKKPWFHNLVCWQRGNSTASAVLRSRFMSSNNLWLAEEPFAIVAAELDGDTVMDVAVAGRPGTIVVYFGWLGSAGEYWISPFNVTVLSGTGIDFISGFALGDGDGDGVASDFILASEVDIMTARYAGSRAWESATLALSREQIDSRLSTAIRTVFGADLSGDGILDFAFCLFNQVTQEYKLYVAINAGGFEFGTPQQVSLYDGTARFYACDVISGADVDLDGDVDLFVVGTEPVARREQVVYLENADGSGIAYFAPILASSVPSYGAPSCDARVSMASNIAPFAGAFGDSDETCLLQPCEVDNGGAALMRLARTFAPTGRQIKFCATAAASCLVEALRSNSDCRAVDLDVLETVSLCYPANAPAVILHSTAYVRGARIACAPTQALLRLTSRAAITFDQAIFSHARVEATNTDDDDETTSDANALLEQLTSSAVLLRVSGADTVLELRNSVFTGFAATAIVVEAGAMLVLRNVSFIDCRGTPVIVRGAGSVLVASDTSFVRCASSVAGALSIEAAAGLTVLMERCSFRWCSAQAHGGALAIIAPVSLAGGASSSNELAQVLLLDAVFEANSAQHGAALALLAGAANLTLVRPRFAHNRARYGGLAHVCGAGLTVVDGLASGSSNNSASAGGGFWLCDSVANRLEAERWLAHVPSAVELANDVVQVDAYGVFAAGAPRSLVWATPAEQLPSVLVSGQLLSEGGPSCEARDLFGNPVVDATVALDLRLVGAIPSSILTTGTGLVPLAVFPAKPLAGLLVTATQESHKSGVVLTVELQLSTLDAPLGPLALNLTACPPGFGLSSQANVSLPCVRCAKDQFKFGTAFLPCQARVVCSQGAIEVSASVCLTCPAGTEPNAELIAQLQQSDEPVASEESAAAIACLCSVGFWSPLARKPGAECAACPTGGVCAGRSEQPIAAPGYFDESPATSAASDPSFVQCMRPNACRGGPKASQCTEGHTGYLCGTCSAGWYSDATGRCEKCPRAAVGLLLLAIGGCCALAALALAGVIFASLKRIAAASQNGTTSAPAVVRRHPSPRLPQSLNLLLMFVQVLVLLGDSPIDWPASTRATLRAGAVLTLDTSVFASDCSLLTWQTTLWFNMLAPLLVLALIAPAAVVALCLSSRLRASTSAFELAEKAGLTVLSLAYMPLTRIMLSVFDCVRLPNATYALEADLGVLCYNAAWWTAAPAGALGLLLYTLGLPSYVARILWQRRTVLGEADTLARYGNIYAAFTTPAAVWAPLAFFVKRLAIVLVVMLISRHVILMLAVLLVLFFTSLLWLQLARPFYAPHLNVLYWRVDLALVAVLGLGLACDTRTVNASPAWRTGITVLVGLAIAFSLMAIAASAWVEVRSSLRETREPDYDVGWAGLVTRFAADAREWPHLASVQLGSPRPPKAAPDVSSAEYGIHDHKLVAQPPVARPHTTLVIPSSTSSRTTVVTSTEPSSHTTAESGDSSGSYYEKTFASTS